MKKQNRNPLPVCLSPKVKTKLLNHDRTEAEEAFLKILLIFLRTNGFSGEVHVRTFLVNQSGTARRPDIYLPRYGLAIEIDGRTRDSMPKRQTDTEARDLFYVSIGAFPPLVIPATEIVSQFKIQRLLNELNNFLRTNYLSPRKRNTLNKRIHDGRCVYQVANPGIFNCSGSVAPEFDAEMVANGFVQQRHFGGSRVILRSKYRKHPKIGVLPLDHVISMDDFLKRHARKTQLAR